MELTVCKFGGTSLASPESIKRVVDIIKADPRRRVIVVSAPGKRSPNDTKITDISPLAGMPLASARLPGGIKDFSPLVGMPLKELGIFGSFEADPAPLKELPLKVIYLKQFVPERDTAILKSIKTP